MSRSALEGPKHRKGTGHRPVEEGVHKEQLQGLRLWPAEFEYGTPCDVLAADSV